MNVPAIGQVRLAIVGGSGMVGVVSRTGVDVSKVFENHDIRVLAESHAALRNNSTRERR
jgi:hypothetical protein